MSKDTETLVVIWPSLERVLVKRSGHESERRRTLASNKRRERTQRTGNLLQWSTFQQWIVERRQYRLGRKRRSFESSGETRSVGRRKRKGYAGTGGAYLFDGVSRQGDAQDREEECRRV